jgi:hypothetical protein
MTIEQLKEANRIAGEIEAIKETLQLLETRDTFRVPTATSSVKLHGEELTTLRAFLAQILIERQEDFEEICQQ